MSFFIYAEAMFTIRYLPLKLVESPRLAMEKKILVWELINLYHLLAAMIWGLSSKKISILALILEVEEVYFLYLFKKWKWVDPSKIVKCSTIFLGLEDMIPTNLLLKTDQPVSDKDYLMYQLAICSKYFIYKL